MKVLKIVITIMLTLFITQGLIAADDNYSLLHMIAPDSGQVLINYSQLDYQDVNLNSKPTIYDSSPITARLRCDFGFDTRGYNNPTASVTGTYTSGIAVSASPGDSVNFNAWFWNDSNDSKGFKIISMVDADAPGADSVTWSVWEDLDGDSIATSADSELAAGSSSITTAGRSGSGSETIVLIALAQIASDATQSAEDTLTVTINIDDSDGDSGIYNQPANKTIVFYVAILAPYMTLSKTVDISDTQPGGRAVFSLAFSNTGNGDAYNVVIEDTIPTYTVPYYGDTIVWIIEGDSGITDLAEGTDSIEFYENGVWTSTPVATSIGAYNVYKSVTKIRFNHSRVNAGSSGTDTFAVLIPWIE